MAAGWGRGGGRPHSGAAAADAEPAAHRCGSRHSRTAGSDVAAPPCRAARRHDTGSVSTRSRHRSWSTADGSRSAGVGITLPGSWTAAAPWATAEASASARCRPRRGSRRGRRRPRRRCCGRRRPGALPKQAPVVVDQQLAVGAQARQDGAGAQLAQLLGRLDRVAHGGEGRPDGLGEFLGVRLDDVGPLAQRRESATGPEVSRAIRAPARVRPGDQLGVPARARGPRGRLPQQAIQSASRGLLARPCSSSSSGSAAVSSGPGALIFVRVPSGSASAMFERVAPATGTGATSMPCASSRSGDERARRAAERQHGDRAVSGGGDGPRDVDALAAGVHPVAGGPEHLAALQRRDLVRTVQATGWG